LSLAKELRKNGARCIFICKELEGNIMNEILKSDFELKIIKIKEENKLNQDIKDHLFHSSWLGGNQADDAAETINLIRDLHIDWIIIDHYGIDHTWQMMVRPHSNKIFVIDDIADRKHECDLLLDHNYFINHEERYQNLVEVATPKIFGTKYTLLQDQYYLFYGRVPPRSGRIKNILIYFGGFDKQNLTGMVVNSLLDIFHNNVTLNVINSNPPESLIKATSLNKNIKIYRNVPSLAPMMLKCDLAFGAGGVTGLERCFMGLPSFVITTAENQIEITKELNNAGLIKWLGHFDQINNNDLTHILKEKIELSDFVTWSTKCLNLFDGLGCKRVSDILLLDQNTQLSIRLANLNDLNLISEMKPNFQNLNKLESKDQYKNWFYNILKNYESNIIYICETENGLELGQVRFEKVSEYWNLSYSTMSYVESDQLIKKMLVESINKFLKSKQNVGIRADFTIDLDHEL